MDTVVQKTMDLSHRSLKKRLRRVIAGAALALCLLGAVLISYIKFQTPNFIAAGTGLFRVMVLKEEVVQISSVPRVVLARPEDAMTTFQDQLAEEGYTTVDQMGRMHIVEKNGVCRQIAFSVNGWFARWIWQ